MQLSGSSKKDKAGSFEFLLRVPPAGFAWCHNRPPNKSSIRRAEQNDGAAERLTVIPGGGSKSRTSDVHCTLGNLEIPGSFASRIPRSDATSIRDRVARLVHDAVHFRAARRKMTSPRTGGDDHQAKTFSTMVVTPIAMVASPTAPCRPRLAQVSQRAETASGTAITVDSAPMPIIEPIPNSAT